MTAKHKKHSATKTNFTNIAVSSAVAIATLTGGASIANATEATNTTPVDSNKPTAESNAFADTVAEKASHTTLEEARKNEKDTGKAADEARKAVDSAEKAVSEANAALDKVKKTPVNTVETEESKAANAKIPAAKTKVDSAETAENTEKNNFGAAKKAYDEAVKGRQLATDALTKSLKEKNDAKAEYDKQFTALHDAVSKLPKSVLAKYPALANSNALVAEKAALAAKEDALTKQEAESAKIFDKVSAFLENLRNNTVNTQKSSAELKAANAALDKANKALDALVKDYVAKVTEAKNNLVKAQSEYNNATVTYNTANKAYEAAKNENVSALVKQNGHKALERSFTDFLTFVANNPHYNANLKKNAKEAFNILTGNAPKSILREYNSPSRPSWYNAEVHLNQGADFGDYMRNVKNTVSYMRAINEYRQNRKLNALNVDLRAMSTSLVDSFYSDDVIDHAKFYNMYENLAWDTSQDASREYAGGSTEATMTGFMKAWITDEKAVYDKYLRQGLTPEQVEDQHHEEVGHYLNFINQRLKTQGFILANNSAKYHAIGVWNASDDDYKLTVDDFARLINDFETAVDNPNAEHNQRVANLKAEADKAKATMEAKKTTVDALNKTIAEYGAFSTSNNFGSQSDLAALTAMEDAISKNDSREFAPMVKAFDAVNAVIKSREAVKTVEDTVEKAVTGGNKLAEEAKNANAEFELAEKKLDDARKAEKDASEQYNKHVKAYLQEVGKLPVEATYQDENSNSATINTDNIHLMANNVAKVLEKSDGCDTAYHAAYVKVKVARLNYKSTEDKLDKAKEAYNKAHNEAEQARTALKALTDITDEANKPLVEHEKAVEQAEKAVQQANLRLEQAKKNLKTAEQAHEFAKNVLAYVLANTPNKGNPGKLNGQGEKPSDNIKHDNPGKLNGQKDDKDKDKKDGQGKDSKADVKTKEVEHNLSKTGVSTLIPLLGSVLVGAAGATMRVLKRRNH